MVCVTAGLDVEPLDDAEQRPSCRISSRATRPQHAGGSAALARRASSPSASGVICRKLRASTMPSAVRAADRTGQLDVALPSQVTWLAEHGVPASLAPVIRARSCGLPANTAAEVCRVSPSARRTSSRRCSMARPDPEPHSSHAIPGAARGLSGGRRADPPGVQARCAIHPRTRAPRCVPPIGAQSPGRRDRCRVGRPAD